MRQSVRLTLSQTVSGYAVTNVLNPFYTWVKHFIVLIFLSKCQISHKHYSNTGTDKRATIRSPLKFFLYYAYSGS